MKEIQVHEKLEHPNIVKYISSFSTNSCYEEKEILVEPNLKGECKVLVLEICPNKSLSDLLKTRKRVTEDEARFFIYHVAEALAYLREKGVMHRDIKLGNIFLDAQLNPKIGDFGLAIISDQSDAILGTPNYIAPEILNGQDYSFPVDTWALGVCLYALLEGRPPFETDDVKRTYRRIKELLYRKDLFSLNANDLIDKIFTDQKTRISITEVLSHPFFTEEPLMSEMPIEARVKAPPKRERSPKKLHYSPEKILELESLKTLWRKSGYLKLDKFYLYIADLKPDETPSTREDFKRRYKEMKLYITTSYAEEIK